MVHVKFYDSHDEWLKAREGRIGGSDAACIIGKNPWKTNVELYREKMGIVEPENISNERAVKYGTQAEPLLRGLFKLDHPELEIGYSEDNMFTSDDCMFAHASLDGWWLDNGEVAGILEIKTATIVSARQEAHWKNRIPDHYYCQVLWYMMVTGAKAAYIQALLRWERNGVLTREEIRSYKIERCPHIETEIKMLWDAGHKFWEHMHSGEEPALILPTMC